MKSYGVHKITKLIAVLRGKCIAVNAHIKKDESSLIIN